MDPSSARELGLVAEPMKVASLATPLLAILSGACATAGPPLGELTPWEPPPGQSCDVTPASSILSARLDTTAIAEGVRASAPADGALLLSVSVDTTGLDRFRRIETDLPESDAAVLEGVVRKALAPAEPSPSRGAGRILLRTAGGAVEELTLGAYQSCRPVLANRPEIERLLLVSLGRAGLAPGTAEVKMRVDTTGAVVEVELEKPSRWVDRNLAFARVARQLEFLPAILDRQPVAVWVAMDLTIELEPARGRRPPR